jgi:hypothetical protein
LTTATLTPASLTFASQTYETSSKAQAVTLENTGSTSLVVTGIIPGGDFSESDNCQNVAVNPGASCTIQVTFLPTQIGIRTGALTISANVSGGALTVALTGTGAPSGVISLTPASLNFGNWGVGVTSTALPVTANNSGSPAIPFTSAISGPFSISSNVCGSSVPATGSCLLTVEFTPTQAVPATGTLTFTDSLGTQTVSLSGTGQAAPTDVISPTSLTFTGTPAGQTSTQSVTLTNNGDLPLTAISASISTSGSGVFTTSNNCNGTLAAHSTCSFSVVFAPTQAVSNNGTLSISDALRTQTVALAGTGVKAPALGVSPSSMTFATQSVNVASSPQPLTVGNPGGVALANVGFQITGQSASSFSLSGNTCAATLAIGGNCSVQVTFKPGTTGGSVASLVVSSSTSGVASVTVPLNGTGQAAAGISVNPALLSFPIVSPGQSSPAQTVTLTNTGGSTATSLTLSVASPFILMQDTCGSSLSAGSSCSTGVVFSPTVAGAFTSALTIASPAMATVASVPLSGTGGTPGSVQFLPIVLPFEETGVGQTSSASTVTITNSDNVTSLNSLALAVSPGFLLVSNNCPTMLPPQGNCTASVEFAPASAGSQQGTLTVTSSALTTGSFLQLTGMGFSFSSAPQGASSQTVVSGQPAYFSLTIQPINGSQGLFTLQCSPSSLPPNSTCIFNPSNVIAVGAGGQGNPTVEITTGQLAASADRSHPEHWRLLPLWSGLILLPLGLCRRRRALLLVAVLAILSGGVSSCTASSSGVAGTTVSTSGVVPSGTYSIIVNITSNPVSSPQQVTLKLVVD